MVYFAHDFTGDGWTDILVVNSRPVFLYVNPKGEARRWDRYNVVPSSTSEINVFKDIDGDGMVAAQRGYQHPINEWNYEEVTVKGSTMKVELNGTVILDCDLSKVTDFMHGGAHPG
jgi:hypothetical protein